MMMKTNTHALIVWLFLCVFLTSSVHQAFAITVSEENEISREFMKEVFTQFQIIDDPEISTYVQKIGEKILATYPPQPFKFRFYVIKNDMYNAFAGPGSQVFIHSGLLEALHNEDELAGVISHEIGHATCRHISKNIDQSGKIGLGTLAGVAAGIFLGVFGSPVAGSAILAGSMAGSQSIMLSNSREDEMQADKIGLEHLNAAGYNGQGMIDAMNTIRSKEWYGKEQIPTYMMTHPATEDRIVYITTWVRSHPFSRKAPHGNDTFLKIRTKLSAMYGDIDEELSKFKTILLSDPENLYAMYGMGIVLGRTGKYDDAVGYLKKVLEKKALDTGILKTLGKIYFDSGHYTNALNIFDGALGLDPFDYECNLYKAKIFLEFGNLDQARDVLTPFASDDKGKPEAFYVLGDVYTRKGMLFESHYYLGMFYKSRHDRKNAIVQFEMALKLARDPDMKKKIRKMIDELKGKNPGEEEKKGDDQDRKGRQRKTPSTETDKLKLLHP